MNLYDSWQNQIKKAMADKIATDFEGRFGEKPLIHTEEMTEGFQRPAFFVLDGYISHDPLMQNRLRMSYSMRVRYHPRNIEQSKGQISAYEEISAVGEWLMEALETIYLPDGRVDANIKRKVRGENIHYAPSENKDLLIFHATYILYLQKEEPADPEILSLDNETKLKENS